VHAPLSTQEHILVMKSTSDLIVQANLLGTRVSESWQAAAKAEDESEGPTGEIP
jgi:hypothetical protein